MRVHGQQQLSLFNAHYDERCFLPIHIYEGASGKPVAMILRAGKTPGGVEVRTILKHVIKRIRGHWPKVRILVRGDSHYGRHEAMEWCENNGVDYIFGLAGNKKLAALVRAAADNLCVRRAISGKEKLRRCLALRYGAKSWKRQRAVVARLEATTLGLDIRYVVTSLTGTAKYLYETVYCARGKAGELHQAAQGPARLRSHLLSRSARQPVAPDLAHRRLLAPAHSPGCCAQAIGVGAGRVQHAAPASDQDRCACRRRRRAHSRLAADSLSRRRGVQTPRWPLRRRRTVSAGAHAPR